MEENWHLLTSSKTAIDIHILDVTILIKKVKVLEINLEGRLNFDLRVDIPIKIGQLEQVIT